MNRNILENLKKEFHSELFDDNGNLKWNSIDHTERSWLEFNFNGQNLYLEKNLGYSILAVNTSIPDLRRDYGEDTFPAIPEWDTSAVSFDDFNEIDSYICRTYNLKSEREIRDFLETEIASVSFAFPGSYCNPELIKKALKHSGIETFGDILNFTPEQIKNTTGLDSKNICSIIFALKEKGLDYGKQYVNDYIYEAKETYYDLYRKFASDRFIDPVELSELKSLQNELGLSDKDVKEVEKEINTTFFPAEDQPVKASLLNSNKKNTYLFSDTFNLRKIEIGKELAVKGRPAVALNEMSEKAASEYINLLEFAEYEVYFDPRNNSFCLYDCQNNIYEDNLSISTVINKAENIWNEISERGAEFNEGRTEKLLKEIYTDNILIPVDVNYKIDFPENFNLKYDQIGRTPFEVSRAEINSISVYKPELIESTYSVSKEKIQENITYRHYLCAKATADYENINYKEIAFHFMQALGQNLNDYYHLDDPLGDRITFENVTAAIPESFSTGYGKIEINEQTYKDFTGSPEDYIKKLEKQTDYLSKKDIDLMKQHFILQKNSFNEILEKEPLLKKYADKNWNNRKVNKTRKKNNPEKEISR